MKKEEKDIEAIGWWLSAYKNHVKMQTIAANNDLPVSNVMKRIRAVHRAIVFRADGRIEWTCSHGVGHTIYVPDKYKNSPEWWMHGCDDCCEGMDFRPKKLREKEAGVK